MFDSNMTVSLNALGLLEVVGLFRGIRSLLIIIPSLSQVGLDHLPKSSFDILGGTEPPFCSGRSQILLIREFWEFKWCMTPPCVWLLFRSYQFSSRHDLRPVGVGILENPDEYLSGNGAMDGDFPIRSHFTVLRAYLARLNSNWPPGSAGPIP